MHSKDLSNNQITQNQRTLRLRQPMIVTITFSVGSMWSVERTVKNSTIKSSAFPSLLN